MKRNRKSSPPAGGGRRQAVAPARRRGAATAAGAAEALPPRLGRWLAIATMVVPPFFVVAGALEAFRLPQRLLAEWLAIASLVALASAGALPGGRALLQRAAPRAALPLLAIAFAGLLFTAHRAHVADALVDLSIGVAALVGWSLALPGDTLRRMLDATLIPATALALLGVLQLHDIWRPLVFVENPHAERLAITSLAGNPGDLAALLVLPCLVAQAGLMAARGAGRWWRLAVLLLMLYALAGTQTLTSLVAVAAGSLVLWAVLLPRRRLLALVAAAVIAAAALVAVVRPLRDRVIHLSTLQANAESLSYLLSGRLDGWRVAARLLREHPLTGVGLGAYRAEFPGAKLRLVGEGVAFFGGHVNPVFTNAHDEYLEVGADLGVPGLLALGWGVALVVRAGWRTRSRLAPADRALVWGGLVAVALLALAYFPFRIAPVAFSWLAWLAWLLRRDDLAESPS